MSLRELLEEMNGEAGIFMENGRISQPLEQAVPLDVLGALGSCERRQARAINCLIERFDIKNDIAQISTLLLDTADTVVTSEAGINFPSETYLVTLTPHNKHFIVVAVRAPADMHGARATTRTPPSVHSSRTDETNGTI